MAQSEIRKTNVLNTTAGTTAGNTITQSIVSGGRVEIRGFGSFMVKDYKPYIGRNPKTGSQIQVPPKKLPFFKVGKELKEMVDN